MCNYHVHLLLFLLYLRQIYMCLKNNLQFSILLSHRYYFPHNICTLSCNILFTYVFEHILESYNYARILNLTISEKVFHKFSNYIGTIVRKVFIKFVKTSMKIYNLHLFFIIIPAFFNTLIML